MEIDKLTTYLYKELNRKIVELSNGRCGEDPMSGSLYWMCEGQLGGAKFDTIYASPFWDACAEDGEDYENIFIAFDNSGYGVEVGPNIPFLFSELTFDAETDAKLYIEKMERLFSKMKLTWLGRSEWQGI